MTKGETVTALIKPVERVSAPEAEAVAPQAEAEDAVVQLTLALPKETKPVKDKAAKAAPPAPTTKKKPAKAAPARAAKKKPAKVR